MNFIIFLLLFFLSVITASFHPCTHNSAQFELNPRGCSWYWNCLDNETNLLLPQPTEELCPDFQHFNYELQECHGFDKECEFDEINFKKIPTKCPEFKSDFIPHFWYCDQYTFCFEGKAYKESCEVEGEHFSYYHKGCTTQLFADCRNDHNYCRKMKEHKIRAQRHPYDCSSYHVCNKCNHRYTLIELHCVNGTHEFDDIAQQCDDATRVGCSVRFD